IESTMDRLIDKLVHVEIAHHRIRKSNYVPTMRETSMDNCLKGHSKLGIDYGVRIRERVPFPVPFDKHQHSDLPKHKIWIFLDLVYTIEYLKTFDFFHKLDENDKRVLAKHITLTTVTMTNSFYSYENKSECTIHPDGDIPHGGQIPRWKCKEEAEDDRALHYESIQRIKDLNMDRKEYVLVKAVIACNPALEDLSSNGRKVMQEQRERYAKSLMSYAMSRRGLLEGPPVYAAMMSHVEWLIRLVKKHKDIHVLICAL
ncbi:hypothetical protein PFISCL1PPCAC_25049, partial [Pristionchus fissidentatus]